MNRKMMNPLAWITLSGLALFLFIALCFAAIVHVARGTITGKYKECMDEYTKLATDAFEIVMSAYDELFYPKPDGSDKT